VTRSQIEATSAEVRRWAALQAAQQRQRAARVRPMLARAARAAGLGPLKAMAHGPVPHTPLPLVTPEPGRVADFVQHLDGLIARAFAADAPPCDDAAAGRRGAARPPAPPARGAPSRACRGHCCLKGNSTQAFLTVDSIAWVRRNDPLATPEAIRDAYLSRVPAQSVAGSCLFHGDRGCTLPRTIRAEICNAWQCDERVAIASQLADPGVAGVVVAGLPVRHVDRPAPGAIATRVVTVTPGGDVSVAEGVRVPRLPPLDGAEPSGGRRRAVSRRGSGDGAR
jgi:hypothetical protein